MPETFLAPGNDYRPLRGRQAGEPAERVTVVIPVYNRVDLLALTLAGLASQTYPAELLRIVVADDGSEEDVAGAVGAAGGLPVEVVRRERSGYGAGQARNMGAAAAGDAGILVFLDADCLPDPDNVTRHAVWHHLADNLVVIGSRHQADTSATTPEGLASDPTAVRRSAMATEDPAEVDWASGDFRRVLHRRTGSLTRGDLGFRSLVSSNFSIRRQQFDRVGGFSEDFTRWGGEDTELGWRLWNEGLFFVDEPRAAVYHQTQEDEGDHGWRERSRAANEGLIQAKIPHRHYRNSTGAINEVPKVSVVVHGTGTGRPSDLWSSLGRQRLADFEVIWPGGDPEAVSVAERRHGDPRHLVAEDVTEALSRSSGEFVALISGAAVADHRLLSRSVSALERRPDSGWVWSSYAIPTSVGLDVFRRREDIEGLDRRWGDLPVFFMTRRRELVKRIALGGDLSDAVDWARRSLEPIGHTTPLVFLPAPTPGSARPGRLRVPRSLRSMVAEDLRAGGADALTAPVRAARAKLGGRPYQDTPTQPVPTRPPAARGTIRYVGWTGRDNMGDEAMLSAVRELVAPMDVTTEGEAGDLLMLGGGTLINRGYLRVLRPLDSPYVERVVFGTGVAHPDFWGDPREPVEDWVAFVSSCAYVGVRGPASAELLSGWGARVDIEVVGDPALSLRPPPTPRDQGKVVVCPAYTRGMLWGESDSDVLAAFASLVSDLRKRGHEVWALSAFPADDRHIFEMMRAAGVADLPYLAGYDDIEAALTLLASADLVVSERLHGAVLGAAAGTVPVMVEYRPKLRDFARSVGLEDLVVRSDGVSGNRLSGLVAAALEEAGNRQDALLRRVDDLRAAQARAASGIVAVQADG